MTRKEKSRLSYFESYDELRAYMALGLPQWIYLTSRWGAVVMNDNVVCEDEGSYHKHGYGKVTSQYQQECGQVAHPEARHVPMRVLGSIEDFPAYEYAVEKVMEVHAIEATTLMDGLYEACEHLAGRLQTADDKRTVFSAKDMTGKNAPTIVWRDDKSLLYRITTPTGCYQTDDENLFYLTQQMETVEGVPTAKRRRFTIGNGRAAREVLMRLTFTTDKEVGLMKKCCCSKKDLRPSMEHPAIEAATGVMVASTGKILVAHQLDGYHCEGEVSEAMVSVPVGVCQMKGRVTVEVTKNEKGELMVTATDEQGRQDTLEQNWRYPNWRSVIPRETGPAIRLDRKALCDATKKMIPHLESTYHKMEVMDENCFQRLHLHGDCYDSCKHIDMTVDMPDGVPGGICVGVSATHLVTMLGFDAPDLHFLDATRALLFVGQTTMGLQMPIMIDSDGRTTKTLAPLEKFDIAEWVSRAKTASKTVKRAQAKAKTEAKKATAKVVNPTDGPSFGELLRRKLLEVMAVRQAA